MSFLRLGIFEAHTFEISSTLRNTILVNKNMRSVDGHPVFVFGGIGIGGRRSGRRCCGSTLLYTARSLPLLKVFLGSFHVAHSARLCSQQGLHQIILIILGDDVLDIKLLIGCKATAYLGGVERLHIDVCLCSLSLDQRSLGLGLVNRSLFRVAQAPQRVELQLVVGFLGHIA